MRMKCMCSCQLSEMLYQNCRMISRLKRKRKYAKKTSGHLNSLHLQQWHPQPALVVYISNQWHWLPRLQYADATSLTERRLQLSNSHMLCPAHAVVFATHAHHPAAGIRTWFYLSCIRRFFKESHWHCIDWSTSGINFRAAVCVLKYRSPAVRDGTAPLMLPCVS